MSDDAVEGASERALVPMRTELGRQLQAAGWPPNITELVDRHAYLVARVEQEKLTYLSLPAALSEIAAHPLYQKGLPSGRVWYRESLYVEDDSGEEVYFPYPFSREEIGEVIRGGLFPDVRMGPFQPALAWRVGSVVGWLSALAVTQPEDAQAGMVVLAALVTPLLMSGVSLDGDVAAVISRGKAGQLAGPKAKGRRPGRPGRRGK